MDHQKLARTLLRVLSIWLLAQSAAQLSSGVYIAIQIANNAPNVMTPGLLWSSFVNGGVLFAAGALLLFASGPVARLIVAEHEKAKA